MRAPMRDLAAYRARATLVRRTSSIIAVVLVIGLTFGVAMASVAAARRTAGAYPVFLHATKASDLLVSVYQAAPNGGGTSGLRSEFAKIPNVTSVHDLQAVTGVPLDKDGAPRLVLTQNSLIIGSLNTMLTRTDQVAVLAGRRFDPHRINQMEVTVGVERYWGVRVGSRIRIGLYGPVQEAESGFGTPKVKPLRTLVVRITGIVALGADLVQDQIDQSYGFAIATPALVRLANRLDPSGAVPVSYGLSLRGGDQHLAAVEAAVVHLVPHGYISEFHVTSRIVHAVALTVRPLVVALFMFGMIAALIGLTLSSQALARLVRRGADERRVLRALGAGPRDLLADAATLPLIAVAAGLALATSLAFALSPLGPIGPVRSVYPHPGLSADGPVLWLGVAAVALSLCALTTVFATASVRRLVASGHSTWRRAPRLVRSLHAAGLPLSAALGSSFALEPPRSGRESTARPVLLGAVVAVALFSTTLTFADGLNTLVSHPALYGWNWDIALVPSNGAPQATLRQLNHDPLVEAWSGAVYLDFDLNGVSTPILLQRTHARVSVALLSGHGLEGPRDVVLGAATAAALHARIGSTITASFGTPASRPAYVAPTRLRVVGLGTFPALGYATVVADHTSMGTGALLPLAILTPRLLRVFSSSDPNQSGPPLVLVRYRPGVSMTQQRVDADRLVATAQHLYAHDRNASSDNLIALGPQRPAQILNYRTIGMTPEILAGTLALGAVAGLTLTLASSVRRRRRDLAILKTLGLRRAQVAATVSSQATVSALVGVVVGIPAGMLVGRALWLHFAASLDAVPRAATPTAALVLVGVGTLVLANVAAFAPGRRASTTPASLVLRAE